ncbi:MAG: hypothetical protein HC941_23590 [Microcoleus sp. SU_5_3]|nr:hypothetical protein [Microcoleus sp. SU_5_3]
MNASEPREEHPPTKCSESGISPLFNMDFYANALLNLPNIVDALTQAMIEAGI